jgi:hypothetical protein
MGHAEQFAAEHTRSRVTQNAVEHTRPRVAQTAVEKTRPCLGTAQPAAVLKNEHKFSKVSLYLCSLERNSEHF